MSLTFKRDKDGGRQDEQNQANSNYVSTFESEHNDAAATLNPPAILFKTADEKENEEEADKEAQVVQGYDMPVEDGSDEGSGADDIGNSGAPNEDPGDFFSTVNLPFQTASPVQQKVNPSLVAQLSKKDGDSDKDTGKVEKKIALNFPDIPLGEKDFKYVKASSAIASSLEVSFMVDKSLENTPDEVAIGPKGLAVKKEGPNLIKKEISDKIKVELKGGLEVNSFGGKVGMEAKFGEETLFEGAAVEFSFVEMDWSQPAEDKIKILSTTIKCPEKKVEGNFPIGGENHKFVAKFLLQIGLEANKKELVKQILMRFGQAASSEIAIAGGMILAGALTIANALYNVYMGKDIRKRIDDNIDQILSYGKGFKAGYTGEGGGGSLVGLSQGIKARMNAYLKVPPLVFDKKLKEEGIDKVFFPAMYQAVQRLKIVAIKKFKQDHGIEDEDNRHLILFKKVLDASTSSNYLQNRILEI